MVSCFVRLLLLALCGELAAEWVYVPKGRYVNWPNLREHPGHYPFCSFLTYRSICNHIIDHMTESFDPDRVQTGDLVYLNVWYVEWFVENVHDQIKHPYILVSGDVGAFVPEPCASKLLYDPKLSAWFCKNILFSYHPKLFQLPMGQDLAIWDYDYDATKDLLHFVKNPLRKKHLLYMNHLPRVHGDRQEIAKLFHDRSYCFSRNGGPAGWEAIPRSLFYEEMASSVFVISPFGLEVDSVRTWEAFALGAIPIVEHTFVDPIYEGLPIVKVHDWNEIDLPFLLQKQQELQNCSREKAFFDYWKNLMLEKQVQVRNGDLSFSKLEASQFSPQDMEDLESILRNYGGRNLLYHGFLTSIRPLQLARQLSHLFSLYLHDPWCDEAATTYLEDMTFLQGLDKIRFVISDQLYEQMVGDTDKNLSVFLDLSYFRTSLNADYQYFRHSLEKDLADLYSKLGEGTLLCGNMACDEYVGEVLKRFEREQGLPIKTRGNFWFLAKEAPLKISLVLKN